MDTPRSFLRSRRCACLWLAHATLAAALGAGTVAGPSLAQAQAVHPEVALKSAREAHEQGRWDAAFAGYVALAEQGHPLAARQALAMWTERRDRLGRSLVPSGEQLARWLRYSACGGHCSADDAGPSGSGG
jgi:hypothetical protein